MSSKYIENQTKKMAQKDDSNETGGIKKKYSYDFRNGIYEGGVAQYKRHGFGMVLLDDGCIYVGGWQNDKVNGRGILFIPQVGVIYSNFIKGMQIGLQIVKLYKCQNEYFCVDVKDALKAPKNVIIYSRDTLTAVQVIVKDDQQYLCREYAISKQEDILIAELHNLSISFSNNSNNNHFRIVKNANCDGRNAIKIGFMSEPHFRMNGIGVIIDENTFQIIKQGVFIDDRLDGMGKMSFCNQDIYEGIFKSGNIEGKGFYYTAKTNSYVCGIFKNEVCKDFISDGLDYPTTLIKKFKQTLHEGSINFYSSQFSSRDFISIDWNYLLKYSEREKYTKHQQKRNSSSPGISVLLDNINTSNTNYFQGTRTNSSQQSQPDSTSSEQYPFQQNLQSQKRSNSNNSYRYNPQNSGSEIHWSSKYSKKYAIPSREYLEDDPEICLSNTQIDFGKLNWGSKPKAEDLTFSHTNYVIGREGQDLYDCLSNDEVYKRQSRINYFQDITRVPTYNDTIKEGEIIKKRLQQKSFDSVNPHLQTDSVQKQNHSNQQSQQSTHRSYDANSNPQKIQFQNNNNNNSNLSYSPISSVQQQSKNGQVKNLSVTVQGLMNGKVEGNGFQNISEYLRNVSDNEQESYLNQKIDISHMRYTQPSRHLIAHISQGKAFCSDYSIQPFDLKKRSSSMSSSNNHNNHNNQNKNGNGMGRSRENSLNERCIMQGEKTCIITQQQHIPISLQNQEINNINKSIIKLKNLYEKDKSKGTSSSSFNTPSPIQQDTALNKEQPKQNTQLTSTSGMTSQLTNITLQPMKFMQALGVPHQNKNDQVGVFLKMKQDAITRQKQQQSLTTTNTSYDITPLSNTSKIQQYNSDSSRISNLHPISYHNGKQQSYQQQSQQQQQLQSQQISQQQNLDSSRMSILHQLIDSKNGQIANQNQIISDSNFQIQKPFLSYGQQQTQPYNGSSKKQRIASLINNQDGKTADNLLTSISNNNKDIQQNTSNNNSFREQVQEIDYTQSTRPLSPMSLIKQRQHVKLNNILQRKRMQNMEQQDYNILSNNMVGFSMESGEKREKRQQPISADGSPYMKTNPTFYEHESSNSFHQNKSMVRFNLNTDPPQISQSFSQKRQSQTPEKSSLKQNIKLNYVHQQINSNNSLIQSFQKQNQRLQTSIDLSNKGYEQNEDIENVQLLNQKQKTKNQWLDLYSVNPQILVSSSPQRSIVASKQMQNQLSNTSQYLPMLV